ncbi:translation factor GTPase family protein [Solibacillus sp. FSL R7-0682]|uniref:translation factor GTPase family protein n=1 Tax=Solibacillus sp. FSL R7-0682 TaxID=2921690 RepID=UPI0030F63F0B
MYKTIGVLAHVDAGKTTFCEQLLYEMSSIKKRGRVDHKDAFLDHHDIERARGITIFAEQGRFEFKGDTYTLIDTPGHVDFSPEMERAIRVMDAAIIIVSAVDGIEGHTETVWRLLRDNNVPTFFFINKNDREGAIVEAVVQQLQKEFSSELIHFDHDMDLMKEWLAERDEPIMKQYFDGTLTDELSWRYLAEKVLNNEAFLSMTGSALKNVGVVEFFEVVAQLTVSKAKMNEPFRGIVFKIRHDEHHRLTFIKALAGTLHVRQELSFGETSEKVTEIRLYNGQQFTSVQQVEAGDVFAVKGLSQPSIGEMIGQQFPTAKPYELIPTLQAKVIVNGTIPMKEVTRIFRLLESEEPSLKVVWREQFQEISVHVMGVIQLEVLVEIMRERFGIEVSFGKPQILYMETIRNAVIGYGHFEPLKHYAEVHLKMEPNERGKGITFNNACHTDNLLVGHQRLIEKHLFERKHHGLLTGFPITDIHFTLLTGRAHVEHTSGGDFREASFRAIRQGLEQAENIVLEPYYKFKMKANLEHIGRMMSDIQQASGTFDAPILHEESVTIVGRVPVSTFMDYTTQFASYTNGKGMLSLQFDQYDVCHNMEQVILEINYQKDADPDYSSSSIFCAKGKGYSVSWQDAKAAMHCPVVE